MSSDLGNTLNLISSLRYDLVCLLTSVLLVISYHLFLRRKIRKTPAYTVQAIKQIAVHPKYL